MDMPTDTGAGAPTSPTAVVLPLWNVEEVLRRPEAMVLVLAGQGAALAAQEYFPQYVCTCGALASDWKVLKGRQVLLWPDAGIEGEGQLRRLAETLQFVASKITFFAQTGQPAGWNLAAALADDWSKDRVLQHVKREGNAYIELLKGKKTKVPAAVAPQPAVPAVVLPSEINLQRDHLLRPHCTEANALEILGKHERYKGRLWFDQFAQRLMIDDKRFDPDDEGLEALIWMQKNLDMHKLSLTAVGRAAQKVGTHNAQHKLKDYLNGLQWDGADRLTGFMANVYGAERNPYTEAIGRCWLISACARVFDPGCKADCMLVLEGPQGARKSTSLRILGGDWFVESHEDPIYNRKDFLGQLQGHWIIEIPEMHSIAGAVNGIEKIKGIISCQNDDYRKVWGKTNQPHPRQCIFAGSTNARQWNSDSTGGRRFWPAMCGNIDLDYLIANRDQIWAEAVSRYKAGEHWWDVPDADAKEQQEMRRRPDIWEPVVEKYITHIPTYHDDKSVSWQQRAAPLEYLQVHRILAEAINKQVSQWNRADEMRLVAVLGILGYEKQRGTVDGVRAYIYRRIHIMPAPIATDDSDVPF